jgi:hypothetical protein
LNVLVCFQLAPLFLGLWWGTRLWWQLTAEQNFSSHGQEAKEMRKRLQSHCYFCVLTSNNLNALYLLNVHYLLVSKPLTHGPLGDIQHPKYNTDAFTCQPLVVAHWGLLLCLNGCQRLLEMDRVEDTDQLFRFPVSSWVSLCHGRSLYWVPCRLIEPFTKAQCHVKHSTTFLRYHTALWCTGFHVK